MIHVLVLHARLPVESDPVGLGRLLTRLPYAKRLELEAREPEAMRASLSGIALALQGMATLRNVAVDVGQLRFPAGGKPYLDGGPSFSVSHGATRVGVALCSDCEVGFDLEEPAEGSGDPAADRARRVRWTAIEAVLKAAGRGLVDARNVELGESLQDGRVGNQSFHLMPVDVANEVVAHLAAEVPVSLVSVQESEIQAFAV